ncbi:histidine kinase [Rhabdobacter roseus]|uniref:Signal transduction histidine kinase internal region domain-containing protein n=1 Tax=Rhabdobacter roseus TaxID=1655419 RepID=A0A840TVH5_9BACT|nr:histidine kinase [Rhabdobacter roseus]MBB5284118.1 hypothetical protein [Rhabdobacter roseus]
MRFKVAIRRPSFWQQWLLHALAVWVVLTLNDALTYGYEVQKNGPYIFNEDGSPYTPWERFVNHNYYQVVWLVVLVGTFLVEANYHVVFRRRPLRYFVGSALLTGVAFQVLLVWFNHWKLGLQPGGTLGPFVVLAVYSGAYALLRDAVQRRIQEAEQRMHRSEAELRALKEQVNPHFFFNTLNSIYGTALYEQAGRTAESIEQLASLMRYTLREAQQDYVPLAEELKFTEDYLRLQRLRLPERDAIRVDTQLHSDGKPALIAPLLLIPFIENAFKYGISMDQPCFVSLRLVIENGQLDFLLENSVLPSRAGQKGQGTGLLHTQKRLELLYPGRYQLTLTEDAEHYRVALRMQLQES